MNTSSEIFCGKKFKSSAVYIVDIIANMHNIKTIKSENAIVRFVVGAIILPTPN